MYYKKQNVSLIYMETELKRLHKSQYGENENKSFNEFLKEMKLEEVVRDRGIWVPINDDNI